MAVADLMQIPCTILRAGTAEDRYGNTNIDWSNPTTITTLPDGTPLTCYLHVAMRKQQDHNVNRSAASEVGTVFLPATADIRANDKLEILGGTYTTLGLPAQVVRGTTGEVHHIEMEVVRSLG